MSNTNLEGLKDSKSESDRDARILRQGRKLFIREFEKQLRKLNSLLDTIRSAPAVDDVKQFYRIVHTLKGSAPMFGYVRIGKLAEDVVRVWEWTQSMDNEAEVLLLAINPTTESVAHSSHSLREMNMEYDICVTEIQRIL